MCSVKNCDFLDLTPRWTKIVQPKPDFHCLAKKKKKQLWTKIKSNPYLLMLLSKEGSLHLVPLPTTGAKSLL